MKKDFLYYVFSFLIVAIIMWVPEMLYSLMFRFKLVNPGVLYGPWVPIYGVGYLFCLMLVDKKKSKIYNFFKFAIIGTIIELITSFILSGIFGVTVWDYSRYPLNFVGRIALHTSLMFGFAGYIFIYKLEPLFSKLYTHLGESGRRITICLMCLFILDLILTLVS